MARCTKVDVNLPADLCKQFASLPRNKHHISIQFSCMFHYICSPWHLNPSKFTQIYCTCTMLFIQLNSYIMHTDHNSTVLFIYSTKHGNAQNHVEIVHMVNAIHQKYKLGVGNGIGVKSPFKPSLFVWLSPTHKPFAGNFMQSRLSGHWKPKRFITPSHPRRACWQRRRQGGIGSSRPVHTGT